MKYGAINIYIFSLVAILYCQTPVRVLYGYTPAVETYLQTTFGINISDDMLLIHEDIKENFETNSQIPVDFRIAAIYRVDYNEGGPTTSIYNTMDDWALTGGTNAEMDDMHDYRNWTAADICILYRDNQTVDATAGLAWTPFIVGEPWDFTSGWTGVISSHEMGHMFSLGDNATNPPATNPAANGYYGIDCAGNWFGTIMTYAKFNAATVKIPFFSASTSGTPWTLTAYYDNLDPPNSHACPPGTPNYNIGDGNNDSRQIIINNLGTVSGFRNVQTTTTLNTPTGHPAGSGMAVHNEDYFEFEASNNIAVSDLRLDNNSEVELRSGGTVNITNLLVSNGAQLSIFTGTGVLRKGRKYAQKEPFGGNNQELFKEINENVFDLSIVRGDQIHFSLPRQGDVKVFIFELNGRIAYSKRLGIKPIGGHCIALDRPLTRNTYIAVIKLDEMQFSKKVVLYGR